MSPTLRTAAAGLTLAAGLGLAGLAVAATPAKAPAPAMAGKPGAAAPAWTVDKTASRIRFKSAFSGMAFEGGFERWDAQIAFDPKNLAGSKAVVSIDLASAKTGDNDRDETLPSGDWFNTAKYPKATFTTTSIKDLGGGKYQAMGTLSMRGVVKQVVLPFTLAITGNVAKMAGSLVLKRNEYGVGQGQFTAADTVPFDVTVMLAVTAKKAS